MTNDFMKRGHVPPFHRIIVTLVVIQAAVLTNAQYICVGDAIIRPKVHSAPGSNNVR